MTVYCLIAQHDQTEAKAIALTRITVKPRRETGLGPDDISVPAPFVDVDVKQSAMHGGWIAYEALKNQGVVSPHSVIEKSGIAFGFVSASAVPVTGPSAGLCFLIQMAQGLIEEFLQFKGRPTPGLDLAATGTLQSFKANSVDGVQAVDAKIRAAFKVLGKGGVILYPNANNPLDPALHEEAERRDIALVTVDTPEQAIAFLIKAYGIEQPFYDEPDPRSWRRVIFVLVVVACIWAITALIPPSPVKVKTTLFYEGTDGLALPLPPDKALTQGDGIRIQFEVDEACFVYVLQLDSADKIAWLFPPEPYRRPIPKGRHWVPADNKWVYLDTQRGGEWVLVLATREPANGLEQMRDYLEIGNNKRLSPRERRELRKKFDAYLESQRIEQNGTLSRLSFRHQ